MRLIALAILVCLTACAAKLGKNIIEKRAPLPAHDFVLVLRQSDDFINDGVKIGSIRSVDNGFSANCSYNEVIGDLKNMARTHGANVIKITRRLAPDKWSSCERIYADIYKVDDYRKHEIEIEWDAQRRLTWADFKAKVPESPSKFQVAAITACEIVVESNVLTLFSKPRFFATNKFSCYASWVKPGQQTDSLLQHEQCHFDIAEVYRRKLQRQLDATTVTAADAPKMMKEMTRQIGKAYQQEQAVYDEETAHGLNRVKQKEWEAKIAALLN
ncbi:DUF922 domain-containing protein [Niabella hibiscisoli]|uniref:DUF922 domain-containing protein n=1 Tax=Niabella hibiscisoli TaxID=1825928 RepID=UPI001F0F6C65|nr:DUF922 domain-containing protein [Niabella hibiscisoli]MCH5719836.1 DUF922 domain-containing protein [Niabella hibiscisoli]